MQGLFGKAMAIEDHAGTRVVFITLDLVGVREELRRQVAERAEEQFHLPPDHLLVNTTRGILHWQGDYAGYAQEYRQRDHPGVTAKFVNSLSR